MIFLPSVRRLALLGVTVAMAMSAAAPALAQTADPVPTTPVPATTVHNYSVYASLKMDTFAKGYLDGLGEFVATIDPATGAVAGDVSFRPGATYLFAFGYLPMRTNFELVPTGRVTGTLAGSALALNTKVHIRVTSVTLYGVQLVGPGASCQTKYPSNLSLKSTTAFTLRDGGSMSGTTSISDLTNCGAMGGLLNSTGTRVSVGLGGWQ